MNGETSPAVLYNQCNDIHSSNSSVLLVVNKNDVENQSHVDIKFFIKNNLFNDCLIFGTPLEHSI
jgi:hypothetical protein